MPVLPSGTVTFLFTDIEGSTRLLERLGSGYEEVLEAHRRLLRAAFVPAGGCEFETQGDALFVAFAGAKDALAAAVAAQRALHAYPWPEPALVRVRMALHTGHAIPSGSGYVGIDLHRTARICAAGHGGQLLLSQATKGLVEMNLLDGVSLRDLGKHRLKDLQRPEQIYQAVIPFLPSEYPPLRSLSPQRHNLPIQITSFIGRDQEIADIKGALTRARLVTLTGSGGCGKTRLAMRVAVDILDEFPDGVWAAELAALSDPALVLQAVASAVGAREEPGRPLRETLTDTLASRRLLILLDNCEHLLPACADLANELLRRCPHVWIMATSREPLDIAGELMHPVGPLPLPDLRHLPAFEDLARFDAVRLFTDRAIFAVPTFALTASNAPIVAQICHRLDGIPLAIELAAARVKVLSVEQIEARLDDRFHLLTGGWRTTLPRHQTLRAAMDWSYELLPEPERALLARLAVFAGGFGLEAAEAVCTGPPVAAVLDPLASLVHRSLVLAEHRTQEARYRFLETVWHYAREKLHASAEEHDVRRRHRDWCLSFAEQAEPELRRAHQGVWLDRLETEHDNMRSALEWSVRRGETEAGLRLAGAFWWFWAVRGYFREGRRWLNQILDQSLGATPRLRARALAGAGYMATHQGDHAAAGAVLQECLAIWREFDDRQGVADALRGLGGVAWYLGDFVKASALYKEGLVVGREAGDQDVVGALLNNLGVLATNQGEYAQARVFLAEGLAIRRDLGDKQGISMTAANLGVLAFREGAYEEARALSEESLAIDRELRDRRGMCSQMEVFALLAAARGQDVRAARLMGAAEALRDAIGAPLSPSTRAQFDYDRYVERVRSALGRDVFNSVRAAGRALALDEAIGYALGG